jgi:hypothetical protein
MVGRRIYIVKMVAGNIGVISNQGGIMKAASVALLMSVLVVGCSSVSNVSYKQADGTFKNQRVISDPHAFAPTAQRSWLEVCQAKQGMPDEPDYGNCNNAVDSRYATVSGYADGIGSAVVHSAGFVGGMYLLGQGIADSGTTVQQSGGGAEANSSSKSYQSQRQSADIDIRNGGHRR